MSNENLIQDLDALLDGTLDDLADAPEFAPFPPGVHRVTMKWERKKIDDAREGYAINFKAIETVEAQDPEKVVSAGQTDGTMFFLKHTNPDVAKRNQGQFKDVLRSLAEHYGTDKKNSELIELSNDAEVLIVTELREEKKEGKKTGRMFMQLKALQVA